ncbi:MAG: peptidase [Nitrosopumilus sp.]|nr:peptidase [Nitrosopumilus sp.]MDH3385427.1 peptidase [Nitrosopumilus sp.]
MAVMLLISFSPVYAQHHSGSLAPPIDFDGLKLAISTLLTPEDFTLDDSKNANLSIRLFDSDTNTNVKSVTYRVQIFHEDDLVANEYFFDEDGKLDLEIKPKTDCLEQELWKCTKYFGEKHPIAGGYYSRGESVPVIQGPVFDKSGQYNIKVSIVGATNPKTMTTKDLLFETFVNIPQKETFLFKTANAQEYPVSIKSYNSKISNFNDNEKLDKISFKIIPNQQNIHQHEIGFTQLIILQKDFLSFKQGYDVDVFVKGMQLDDKFVDFDNLSPNENIIRIKIPHEEYMSLEKNDNNPLTVEVLPGNLIEYSFLDLTFDNNIQANVSWDSKSRTGEPISFTFSFFDADNNPAKEILFAYSITDSSGKEIWSNIGTSESHIGILAKNGVIQESIFIPTYGEYQLKLILTGQNSQNFEEFFTSKSDLVITQPGMKKEQTITIPSWIKTNAGWWSTGIIGDQEFVQSIQFLIKEDILKIPITESSLSKTQEIPDWIKTNTGWWAEGLLDDSDFVLGIQFLISSGIMVI